MVIYTNKSQNLDLTVVENKHSHYNKTMHGGSCQSFDKRKCGALTSNSLEMKFSDQMP